MAEDTASNLVGKRISTTFRGLLHLPHSIDITNPNIKQIVYDGQGTETSLNLAGSGYGAQIFGDLTVDKAINVGTNLNITNKLSLSGDMSTTGSLSVAGNVTLLSGGKVNDVYFPENSTTLSLSAPNALSIGKINLIETASDYEINFGSSKLFSIYVKKTNPNNLYIKSSGITNEKDSPLWINTATNEVNIANLRLSSIATNPTIKTPNGTDTYRNVMPTGSILMFPGPLIKLPNGWFECNGNEYDIADYGDLFDIIGYTYGTPSTLAKFKLPDLRGYFVRGLQTNPSLLDGGRTVGNIQQDAIKTHQHASTGAKNLVETGGTTLAQWQNTGTSTAWAGTVNSDNLLQGNNIGGDIETRPKNMALIYCIKW
jgi:microcystin-dependent protein